MEVKNTIVKTLKEVCDVWKIEEEQFIELENSTLDVFQSFVKKLVKAYYIYYVMLYEESVLKLKELRDSVGDNVKEFVLRHYILKVYLEGGTLGIN